MSTGYRKHIEAALPGTTRQLTAKSGLSRGTVDAWIKVLRAEGNSHISGWSATGTGFAAIHTAGPGEDKPRPRARTQAEYSRKHIKQVKASGEWQHFLAKRRGYELARRIREGQVRQDPIAAALFGRRAPWARA